MLGKEPERREVRVDSGLEVDAGTAEDAQDG